MTRFERAGANAVSVLFASVSWIGGASNACGDLLTIQPTKQVFEQYEPLEIDVVFTSSTPLRMGATDPVEAQRQRRRLSRRFDAELYRGDVKVAGGWLACNGLAHTRDRQLQFRARYITYLGNEIDEPKESYEFFGEAGSYELQARDEANGLVSNRVAIRIVPGSNLAAMDSFRSDTVNGLGLLLLMGGPGNPDTVFGELLKDHPETIWARYARAALAIRRAQLLLESDPEGKDKGKHDQVVSALRVAAGEFSSAHPMHLASRYYLARLQLSQGQLELTRQEIDALRSAVTDGHYAEAVNQLEVEIEMEKAAKLLRNEPPASR